MVRAVTLADLAAMNMRPQDLSAQNRAKREVAISGAAGTADIPYLYELLLQGREQPQFDLAPPPALPEEDLGNDLAFDYFASPGAEASALGLGAAPAPALRMARMAREGRGTGETMNLSAANPATGIAPSYSPELEAFLEDTFPALMDPTVIGRHAPVVGPVMNIAEALQEEDYLGLAEALLDIAAVPGLATVAGLATGTPIDPAQIGQMTLDSLTDKTPLGLAKDIVGEGLEGRVRSAGSGPSDTELEALASAGEISAAPFDSETGQIGAQTPSGPQPGMRDFPSLPGLSGPESQAVQAGLTPADMNPSMSAGIAGYDEEEDELEALMELGMTPAEAAQVAAAVTPAALAAAPPSLSLASLAAFRGGGGSSSSSFRGGSLGPGTAAIADSNIPGAQIAAAVQSALRGGSRSRSGRGGGRGGGNGGSGGSTGAGTAGAGGGGGNAGW